MVSVYPEQGRSEWILQQRPARSILDHNRPHAFFLEEEMDPSGRICSSGVILLTNRECPWRCLMCDLWKNTVSYTVPEGAIAAQIHYALEQFDRLPEQLKLYNSGSFFDAAAVPLENYASIAKSVPFAKRVIVECHPRLIGEKALRFRNLLNRETQSLEVAMGLETVHPFVLPRLNKRFELSHFAAAIDFLRTNEISCRAFVLVKPPFLTEEEASEWAVKSAHFAFDSGAKVVSLIPTRAGNGAMERLIESGEFSPPRLTTIEKTFDACLVASQKNHSHSPGSRFCNRVFVDTWNLDQFSRCVHCFGRRFSRLLQMNLSQQILPPIQCPACGNS